MFFMIIFILMIYFQYPERSTGFLSIFDFKNIKTKKVQPGVFAKRYESVSVWLAVGEHFSLSRLQNVDQY